ncbi:cell envelope integrity protein TolA [Cedecea neteri]|uniref:Cell envelope integrity inner membrane protein TolA n=1 Tax=Cedecea neteri TaxID=158822 RepID=A0AAN0S5F8_9ENTR|nr:cell envelope integrity protein TolA [Cedecea neteri]AIR61565.1 hypothetical protein LH23_13155 [Cedecea neteri]NIG74288.1 cell envelope integrity protein TolA [Klebsiella sp. Ap-873]WNJ78067.1 cell envelope integrity protein TolA [Cedecea neteri]
MNRKVYLLAATLLIGCQGNDQQSQKQKQEFRVVNSWANDFINAVMGDFSDINEYAGRSCTIRVHQPKGSHKITGMRVVEGDTRLCIAATKAIQAASDKGVLPLTPGPVGEEFPLDINP